MPFWPSAPRRSLSASLLVAALLLLCHSGALARRRGPPFGDTPTQRRLIGDGGDDTAFPTVADSTHHLVYEQRADAEARLEEDLRREFVRTAIVDKDDMTYRYPKKAYKAGRRQGGRRRPPIWSFRIFRPPEAFAHRTNGGSATALTSPPQLKIASNLTADSNFWNSSAELFTSSPNTSAAVASGDPRMRFALLTLTMLVGQWLEKRAAEASRVGRFGSSNSPPPPPPHDYADPDRGYGMIPRKFQCYSCMSTSYENNWHRLQHLYVQPKKFSDDCERPAEAKERMPTVECGSVCVSLVEPDVEGGVFLGFKYIRGCINRILTHDFNLSALRTHRMPQMDFCRNVPRAVLFSNPRNAPEVFGEVNLCTCFGDRCNSASQSAAIRKSPFVGILLIFAAFLFRL